MKKLKIFSLLSVFALCLCTLGIGVWAAKQTSFSSSGNITFNAIGTKAKIEGTIKNAGKVGTTTITNGADHKLDDVLIDTSSSSNLGEITSWKNNIEFRKDLTTSEEAIKITFQIKITNQSDDRPLWVYIHDNAGVSCNLKREITNGAHARKILAGKDDTFNIEISVYSLYNKVGSDAKYDYTINLYDETAIKTEESTNLIYSKITGTTNAEVRGFKTGDDVDKTSLVIEPLIKIGEEVCVVTNIFGNEHDPDAAPGSLYIFTGDYSNTYLPFTLLEIGSYSFNNTDVLYPYTVKTFTENSVNSGYYVYAPDITFGEYVYLRRVYVQPGMESGALRGHLMCYVDTDLSAFGSKASDFTLYTNEGDWYVYTTI